MFTPKLFKKNFLQTGVIILIVVAFTTCQRNELYTNAVKSDNFFLLELLSQGAMPVLTPAPGTFEYDQQVTITCQEPGAEIRYTTDGSAPTLASTLYVAPIAVTGRGIPRIIRAITVIDGEIAESVSGTYNIDNTILYVHTAGADNVVAGWGSSSQPYQTISFAMGQSAAGSQIRVAAGNYNEGADITLVANITLLGGYNAADWTDRNNIDRTNATYQTNVNNVKNRSVGFTCNIGISGVIVDGFVIYGGNGGNANTSGISIGGSMTVRNNTIYGGNGTTFARSVFIAGNSSIIENNIIYGEGGAGSSIGVHCVTAANPVIRNNNIDGGSGSGSYGLLINQSYPNVTNNFISGGAATGAWSYGVYVSNCTAMKLFVESNTIYAGSSINNSYGIYDSGSANNLYVRNNTIHAGNGVTSTGVYVYDADTIIQNNTINIGDTAPTRRGVRVFSTGAPLAHPYIDNNIIFDPVGPIATNYAIVEETAGTSSPNSVNNNCFFNFINYYVDEGVFVAPVGNFTTIVSLNLSAGNLGSFNNIDAAPTFTDADANISTLTSIDDWRLIAPTPLLIYDGGLDLTSDPQPFNNDKSGAARTVPWSIGAYEY